MCLYTVRIEYGYFFFKLNVSLFNGKYIVKKIFRVHEWLDGRSNERTHIQRTLSRTRKREVKKPGDCETILNIKIIMQLISREYLPFYSTFESC